MIWDQNQTNFLSFVELVMSYAEEQKKIKHAKFR